MDKIKRFIDINVPVTTCTLRCHYCYITQHRLFSNKLPKFKYIPEQVGKALSKERLGGVCLINLCGNGETLLPSEMVDYIRVLLEQGHYVMVVTNGTVTKRFDEIAKLPKDFLSRLFFKFSFHYLELKKRNLFDNFFSNVQKMIDAGCSFTLEVTPSDELIPYIDEMKNMCINHVGALCHITVARDERDPKWLPILTDYSRDEYKNIWDTFNSDLFSYKMSVFGVKRDEFCYAGDWSFCLNLGTGIKTQCYKCYYEENIFDDLSKPINFRPVGNMCSEYHCYNAHAFLTLGNIPSLISPTYDTLRNRVCNNGKEWLNPQMKSFMHGKLSDSNNEYTEDAKRKVNKLNRISRYEIKAKSAIHRIKSIISK